jgi:hypothetical protein
VLTSLAPCPPYGFLGNFFNCGRFSVLRSTPCALRSTSYALPPYGSSRQAGSKYMNPGSVVKAVTVPLGSSAMIQRLLSNRIRPSGSHSGFSWGPESDTQYPGRCQARPKAIRHSPLPVYCVVIDKGTEAREYNTGCLIIRTAIEECALES